MLQSFFGLHRPTKKIVKLSYLRALHMIAAIFEEGQRRTSVMLYDATSLSPSCEAAITIAQIASEVAIACKDESHSSLRKHLKKA